MAGIAAICAGLAGCTTPPASASDPFCPAIREFANATPVSTTRSVELTTSWFTGDPPSTGAQCKRSDAGAQPLCVALVTSASREFMIANVERVLACMSKTGRVEGLPVYAVKSLDGEVSSWEMPGVDKDVSLTLTFAAGETVHPPLLRIAAKRVELPR